MFVNICNMDRSLEKEFKTCPSLFLCSSIFLGLYTWKYKKISYITTTDSQCFYHYFLKIYSKAAWPFIELNERIEVIQAACLTRIVRRLSEDLQDISVGNITITYDCKRKPKDCFRRRSLPWKICRCSKLIHFDVAGRYSFVIMPKHF